VDSETPVISTVHPLQVVEEEIPMTSHDVPLNMIITTKAVIETTKRDKPQGILWDELNEEKLESIPILKKLRQQGL
jgi:5-formyltetrahydrofolate cyclo-ligase